MSLKQYAPLSLTGAQEVIMVSLRRVSGIWLLDAAPSVSPVVGKQVGCEWLTQTVLGASRLQATDQIPNFTAFKQNWLQNSYRYSNILHLTCTGLIT